MPRTRYQRSRQCECGCGGWTRGGKFLPGHDAKLKSILLQRARAGDTTAQAELERRGWVRTVAANGARRFGVEIEFMVSQNIGVAGVVEALAAQGLTCSFAGYTHEVRSTWKLVTDGSLRAARGDMGLELVSPPMAGADGFEQLRKACAALATVNAKINRSCGLHVHHEARDMNVAAVRAMVANYTEAQMAINSILPASRHNSSYAAPWAGFQVEELNHCTTIQAMARVATRYKTVNLCSYPKYGTVELRQHSGSVEYAKISAWVRFGQAMMDAAKAQTRINAGTIADVLAQITIAAEDRAYWLRRAARFAVAA